VNDFFLPELTLIKFVCGLGKKKKLYVDNHVKDLLKVKN